VRTRTELVHSLAVSQNGESDPALPATALEDPDFLLITPYKRFLPQRKNTKKDTHAQSDAEGENGERTIRRTISFLQFFLEIDNGLEMLTI